MWKDYRAVAALKRHGIMSDAFWVASGDPGRIRQAVRDETLANP
jgi:hypothetical protein